MSEARDRVQEHLYLGLGGGHGAGGKDPTAVQGRERNHSTESRAQERALLVGEEIRSASALDGSGSG